MIVLIICLAIPLLYLGIVVSVCEDAKDDCYHCSSGDESTCSTEALINGYTCYYTDGDYDFVCEKTTGKLWYVVACFIVGAILELVFSIMSCVACTAIKNHRGNQPN